MAQFAKPYLPAVDHVKLMKSRGLVIEDEEFAIYWIESVGYFRLTGYGLQLREKTASGTLTETFLKGATFSGMVRLYEFDRHLRLLILDAVERVEVAFRTRLNNSMAAKYGPHWFMDADLFSKKINEKNGNVLFDHVKFLEGALEHQQTPFIKKYLEKYTDPPYPACWMLAETITFGVWSRAFGMLENSSDQKPVATAFRTSIKEMSSWSQVITDLRNKCAHQSRVWDHRFVSSPTIKGNLKGVVTDGQCLFGQIATLIYCLWTIEPDSIWLDRLDELLEEYSMAKPSIMGFPEDWKNKLSSLRAKAVGSDLETKGSFTSTN